MNTVPGESSIWFARTVTRWDVFTAGYLAGITAGIGMGRAQVSQEFAHAEIFPGETPPTPSYESTMFAAPGLSRVEVHTRRAAEHTTDRRHYVRPGRTAEEIRANAFRSWGLRPTTHRRVA